MRVVAAMSGGVDSAVAASRMIEAGHDVVGVHLALAKNAKTLREGARGCCTIEDAGDARRVADRLGIPFYVWDMATPFARGVVDDFVNQPTTMPWGNRSLLFRDPDGNLVNLFSPATDDAQARFAQ